MKFVEASFVTPLLVLILVLLITFSIGLYYKFESVVKIHLTEIEEVYQESNSKIIREYEAFLQ